MHIHILGICGTFMGGLAVLARQLGFTVSGSDQGCYPPMSTQLESHGIHLRLGYEAGHLQPEPDLVVVGNALSRGNPAVEYMLDRGLPYTSGPAFLAEHLLRGRWVLAVAGTHGKTTTASMVAWVLDAAGLSPGFLIGGVPGNFGRSARLGEPPFFVVEADEYDTAFFDKRSKFIHYHPRTLVINNLEFDHADIFPDLAAIQRQFHHLVRTVPGTGLIIAPAHEPAVAEVLEQGCWTPVEVLSTDPEAGWSSRDAAADSSRFSVCWRGQVLGEVNWSLGGSYNIDNALAAIAAVRHAGVPPTTAIDALSRFQGVRRRLEVRGEIAGVTVYDDFAHHPTAIALTIDTLRPRVGAGRLIAVLEPGSNTMRLGIHGDSLAASLAAADQVVLFRPPALAWDPSAVLDALGERAWARDSVAAIVAGLTASVRPGDHVLIMSNRSFDGIHEKLLEALRERQP